MEENSNRYFQRRNSHKVEKVKEVGKQKIPKRLSTSELQALFRRLDVNGDGDLSLPEFKKILNKLNLKSPSIQDQLEDIFKIAARDSSDKGSLEIDEFIVAYNILYRKFSYENTPTESVQDENWVRATRYGFYCLEDDDKKYIFECYVGSMANITHKVIYHLPNLPDDEDIDDIPPIELSSLETDIINLKNYSIETINRLILEDGDRNKKLNTRVMWWVDVSSKKSSDYEINKFMNAFGISESVKNNFRDVREPLVHSVGEVVCEPLSSHKSYLGKASVLSMFLQSLYLKNKPLVQRDPAWVEKIPFGLGSYASSRLSIFYYFYGLKCKEANTLIRRAKQDADKLLDNEEEEFSVEFPSITQSSQTATSSKTTATTTAAGMEKERNPISNAHQCTLGLPSRASEITVPYLLSISDMIKRTPTIVKNNISVHVQDQGYGPMALLSFRTIDSELKDSSSYGKWSLDQHSRAGILGRIMHGVWLKLFEVTTREGVTNICAELDDSSFALAVIIAFQVQSVNMEICDSLKSWAERLAFEIDEFAASRHSKHIAFFNALLAEAKSYADTFHNAIIPIVHTEDQITEPNHESSTMLDTTATTSDDQLQEEEGNKPMKGYAYTANYDNKVQWARVNGKDVYESCKNLISKSPLPDGIEFISPSVVVNMFAINDTKKLLIDLLNGIDKLERGGTNEWLERLHLLHSDSSALRDRYQTNLDEKRNFWAFILGIVTIATFPFCVLTGYFGMNFENMSETNGVYTGDFFPAFPGQNS